jgi:hypothetical protein
MLSLINEGSFTSALDEIDSKSDNKKKTNNLKTLPFLILIPPILTTLEWHQLTILNLQKESYHNYHLNTEKMQPYIS